MTRTEAAEKFIAGEIALVYADRWEEHLMIGELNRCEQAHPAHAKMLSVVVNPKSLNNAMYFSHPLMECYLGGGLMAVENYNGETEFFDKPVVMVAELGGHDDA